MRDLVRKTLDAYAVCSSAAGLAATAAGGGTPFWLEGDAAARWGERMEALAEHKPATAAAVAAVACAAGMVAGPLWLPASLVCENWPRATSRTPVTPRAAARPRPSQR